MSAWTLGGNVVKGAGRIMRGAKPSSLASETLKEEDEENKHSGSGRISVPGSVRGPQNSKRYVNVNSRKNNGRKKTFDGHLKVHDEEALRGFTGCLPTHAGGGWGIDTELIEVEVNQQGEKEVRLDRTAGAKRQQKKHAAYPHY